MIHSHPAGLRFVSGTSRRHTGQERAFSVQSTRTGRRGLVACPHRSLWKITRSVSCRISWSDLYNVTARKHCPQPPDRSICSNFGQRHVRKRSSFTSSKTLGHRPQKHNCRHRLPSQTHTKPPCCQATVSTKNLRPPISTERKGPNPERPFGPC